jgi:hypothetical protein
MVTSYLLEEAPAPQKPYCILKVSRRIADNVIPAANISARSVATLKLVSPHSLLLYCFQD